MHWFVFSYSLCLLGLKKEGFGKDLLIFVYLFDKL